MFVGREDHSPVSSMAMRTFILVAGIVSMLAGSGCSIDRFLPEAPDADLDIPDPWWDVSDGSDRDAALDGSGAEDDASRADADTSPGLPDREFVDTGPRVDTGGDSSSGVVPPPDPPDRPVFDAPPLIGAVYPNTGPTSGGTIVVVEGSRFPHDIEVYLGGQRVTHVDVVDGFELLFVTEPRSAGTYDLKLVTDGGSAEFADAFTFVAPLEIHEVDPSFGSSPGGYLGEVHGAGFGPATAVLFGGREARVVERRDSTSIVVEVPPGPRDDSVDVIAVDTRFARLVDGFEYRAAPRLNAVVPPLGAATGGERVRLDGVGLSASCVAYFDGIGTSIEVASSGWPEVVTPGGLPGVISIGVDCGEAGEALLTDGFRYLPADTPPGPLSVWPARGFERGGEIITVAGVDLDDVSSVLIGGETATILRTSYYAVDVLTPAHAPGAVHVDVELDGVTTRLDDAFTFVAVPTFITIEPSLGTADGGWTATLTGRDFDAIDAVMIDGRDVTITGRTTSSITIVVPRGAPGISRVRVRLGALEFNTGLDITYAEDRAFDTYFPPTGAISGGSLVYVRGDGMSEGCTVYLDGEAASTSLVSSRLLVAIIPPHAPGFVPLEVRGCGDTWRAPAPFQYVDPTRLPGGVGGGGIDGELRVSVRELGTNARVEGATVMVRVRSSSPYVAVTDALGQVTFTGDDLVGPQTVTAFAPGRSAESYVNVNAREVTLMLNPLPSPPCDPSDPACQPPAPLPNGEIIGFLTGLHKIIEPPPGTRLAARLETTRVSPGFINPDPGPNSRLYEEGAFSLTTRLGNMALIALCGYEFIESGQFVPLSMGIVRGIHIRPGALEYRTVIDCNIPLDQELSIKLVNTPTFDASGTFDAFPGVYRARVTFDLAGDGFFQSLPEVRGEEQVFSGGRFPRLAGDLQSVRFEVVAGAYPTVGTLPFAETYLRGLDSFQHEHVFPPLLAVPEITFPASENSYIADGYVEWESDPLYATPDFYLISATSAGEGFPRWTLYVPGYQRSFHFADFPELHETIGEVDTPGGPTQSLALYIRAIDVDVFDYDDFDRLALRARSWRAASGTYRNFLLQPPPF